MLSSSVCYVPLVLVALVGVIGVCDVIDIVGKAVVVGEVVIVGGVMLSSAFWCLRSLVVLLVLVWLS